MGPESTTADSLDLADLRRLQIIGHARRLFGERGTTDVSMDEIATTAGVARSTVYVYFANRAELVVACIETLYDQMKEAATSCDESDPGTRLENLFEALLSIVDAHPAFFRLAIATQGSPDQSGVAVAENLGAIGVEVAGVLTQIVAEGTTRALWDAPDPSQAAALIGQQLFGALLVRALEPSPEPSRQAAQALRRFVIHGLNGSWPQPEVPS